MTTLHIPVLEPGCDTLTAALAYAEAGWFVGPCRSGTKNPGSVLGEGWDEQTSRDTAQITAWFAGTNHGLFLHAGRSGAVILDVDHPERIIADIEKAIADLAPPYQSTRADQPGRGHYLFGQPDARDIGNSLGSLGNGWGEIRGRNGVIIVEPSVHVEADGRYKWETTGPVPMLPGYLAEQLPDALDAADPATGAEVAVFLAEHSSNTRPELLNVHAAAFTLKVERGESRHESMNGHLTGEMKEAAAGLYDATLAADTLEGMFLAAVAKAPQGPDQGPARAGAPARKEWRGLLAWAVGQARAADPDETRARSAEKVPPLTVLPDTTAAAPVTPINITECHRVFARWLGADYDTDVLDVVLSAAAAEQLHGDPPWLLIVSGSGAAKTETASALAGAGALITSTITSEGALLSATSARERSKDATGGLLRKIGGRGVLVIKDMTSILSMDRTARGSVLAALREIYDGKWERNVGVDGGRSLNWTGRIIVIGAVTTAWDSAHTVISSMGDRFVLVRLDSASGRAQAGRQAIRNSSSEVQMRAELSAAVAALMAGVDTNPAELSEDDVELLLGLADVVTLTRTAVEVDYRGDVIDAHAPEMPTRFAKQLTMIVRGATAVGIGRADAFALALRCARDSMPPLRLAVLHDIRSNGGTSTHAARKRLNRPRSTVDRAIQALHALGLVDVDEVEELHGAGFRTVWQYTLSDLVNIEALDLMGVSRNVGKGALEHREERKEEKEGRARPPTNISGTTLDPVTGISRDEAGWTGRQPGEPLPEAGDPR